MALPLSNITSNSAFGLQSNFNTKINGLNSNSNKTSAYYAKKGEPMYMKEMDSDDDGIVSFDEFKEYCQSNGISTREMVSMSKLASSYRTMQAQKKAFKSINNQSDTKPKEIDNEAVYAKRGDGKYDSVMDKNNDDKVSYKEYMEYCRDRAKTSEQKSNTKFEETEDGELKITNPGKAVKAYSQEDIPESRYEETV